MRMNKNKNENENILIIDHYSIDEKWENNMKKYFKKMIGYRLQAKG